LWWARPDGDARGGLLDALVEDAGERAELPVASDAGRRPAEQRPRDVGHRALTAQPELGIVLDLGQDRDGGVAVERPDAGQALEQHAAEREHVGPGVDRLARACLLGGHVTGGPEHHAGLGELGLAVAPGDAEVEHLDQVDAASGEDQVGGLEIAVDDPACVRARRRAPRRPGSRG
jgi:hypothetical protein